MIETLAFLFTMVATPYLCYKAMQIDDNPEAEDANTNKDNTDKS